MSLDDILMSRIKADASASAFFFVQYLCFRQAHKDWAHLNEKLNC